MRVVTRLGSIAAAVMLYAGSAHAMELVWSSGSRDIHVQAAQQCTLLVIPGLGEVLPRGWSLAWSAGSRPLQFITESSPPGIAGVCTVRPRTSMASVRGRVDTLVHCSTPADVAPVARYILLADSATTARIVVWGATRVASSLASEVTINGGTASPYPPVLESLLVDSTAVGTGLRLRGRFLGAVTAATLFLDNAVPSPLAFVLSGDDELTATTQASLRGTGGYVTVATSSGEMGAIRIADPETPRPRWSADHILLQFEPQTIDPPLGRTDALLADFRFVAAGLSDSLAAEGVVRLEKLFPLFQHDDVHSRNLLGEPVELEDLADVYVAHLAVGRNPVTSKANLDKLSRVKHANLDYATGTYADPTDPYFVSQLQWGLRNTGQSICGYTDGVPNADVGVAGAGKAWDRTTGSPTVRIAILDTGIDNLHPDLTHAILDTSYVAGAGPFDDAANRHGSAVAGIAAAKGNNGVGVVGVAFNATPVAIKIFDSANAGTLSNMAKGIDRARVKGYPIINISGGAPANEDGPPPSNADIAILNLACRNAFLAGHFVVAASGNTGIGGDEFTDPLFDAYPAALALRVFAVGAITPNGKRWRDPTLNPTYCATHPGDCNASNYGLWLDVNAPGGQFIVTTKSSTPPDSFYHLRDCGLGALEFTGFRGTSAAAPFVSGVAALLKSFNNNLTGDDIEQIIIRTATYIGVAVERRDVWNGYGWPRANSALTMIASPNSVLRNTLSGEGPQSYLRVMADSVRVAVSFRDVPGLPATYPTDTTTTWRVRLHGSARYGKFTIAPKLWVRPTTTKGWRDTTIYNYAYEVPFARPSGVGTDSTAFDTYVYRIAYAGLAGGQQYFPVAPPQVQVDYTAVGVLSTAVGVDEGDGENTLALVTSPNPAMRGTWVSLALGRRSTLRITMFDVTGRNMATISDGMHEAGQVRVWWDARARNGAKCQPGVYWCLAEVDGIALRKSFVLLAN